MSESTGLGSLLKATMLDKVPTYANRFFYSLGFLSAISFVMLFLSGLLLIVNGPSWWLTNTFGIFIRSIHLWSTQAFVLFIILHVVIVFFTYAYRKPRQLTWVLGGIMLFTALFEAEFGYLLRGDFSSQWRSLQASDLYNGSGLGAFINNLNYSQIYGIHIGFIPVILLVIVVLHYSLVKKLGIAAPHKVELPHTIVPANHTILFVRGGVLVLVILALATAFKSPLIDPVTIQNVANNDPALMAKTLVAEIDHSSDTATYVDGIAPYSYDTGEVYVYQPYKQLMAVQPANAIKWLDVFSNETIELQDTQIKDASTYYENGGSTQTEVSSLNPVVVVVNSLVSMAQTGLYEGSLRQAQNGTNATYVTRFLADTGVLEDQAKSLGITTEQYGMMREEAGHLPGAWWLAPVGVLDHTVLANDENQDRHGAEILGVLILLFLAFPYIPYVNQVADKLSVYKLIWKEKK